MKIDYSKLLPAVFDGKDIEPCDTADNFFNEIGDGNFVKNSMDNTYLGFVCDQEVRLHTVVNRITIEFINGKPSEEILNKVKEWLDNTDEMNDFVVNVWTESKTKIVAQYYWNPYV